MLARECGWDKDFIADHFTVQQIQAYYKVLSKQKLRDLQMQSIATLHAVATAFGTMEKKAFMEFLDKLQSTSTPKSSFEDLKGTGLPIEDK